MPFETPFTLGPFTVDLAGGLAPRIAGAVPGFGFRWRDRQMHARLQGGRLLLRAMLGRIPSTAAPPASDARLRSLAMLRCLPPTLPAHWRIALLADHRLQLETDAPLAQPTTATRLVAEVTSFLLRLDPYLDVLDADGVGPLATAAGSTKI